MEKYFNNPSEAVEANVIASEGKASLSTGKMVLAGMFAGAFIAFGAVASSTAAHGVADVGLGRVLAGAVFPVGLMMVVLLGGELFTGNCLMVTAALEKRITWKEMLRNLLIVYFSNMAGALFIAGLLAFSGNLDYSGGLLGAYTIKIAVGKAGLSPIRGIASGILCNILVCAAVLMAAAAKDIAGKIWAVFFPIAAFVTGGFEHCVANMFYIPAGMIAAMDPAYAAKAQEAYGISAEQMAALNVGGVLQNLLPVTLGNLIGGMALVGIPMFFIHRKGKA